MPFNLETWKAQASQRLGEAKTWLGRRASENAPLLAYSTLGMLCLAPLANALANPNMTTMVEAATVLSGLGSNLLAGELQKWKDAPADQRDETLRESLAVSLLAQNENSQQLRKDLDKVLQTLDALSETRKHLPPAEQPDFAAQWQQEVQRIGSQVLIQGDWVMGDKVMGDKIGQQINHHHYATPDPALKYAETRRAYLRWLANEVNRVPLHEVDPQQNNPKADAIQLKLCDVYIGLDTTRAGSALEAVLRQTKTVLTGEPGSGKSTFVHHLIYSLAMHQLAPDPAQLQAFYAAWQEEAERKRLPVRVILRDFDAWLCSQAPQAASPKCLLDFIAKVLGDNGQAEAFEMLQTALKQGAVLLVLDGLDEVTQFSQRKLIRDIITKFSDAFYITPEIDNKTETKVAALNNRYVLTCRTRSYEQPVRGGGDVRLPQFIQYKLALFDEAKIKAFVHAWYAELLKAGRFSSESSANAKRNKLLPQLQKAEFRRMAGNPLQLTLMAWVHTDEELPERRAQLYDRAIDLLLWHRESKKEGKRLKDLLVGLEDAQRRVRAVLAEAAYLAHTQISRTDQDEDREKLADVSESGLVAALAQLRNDEYGNPNKAWAQLVVDAICDRSGLLARRVENNLTFPHRTFQEYLAACHLIKLKDFVTEAGRLTADANKLAVWREVILLAVGKDKYVDDQHIALRPEKLAAKLYKQTQKLKDESFFITLTAFWVEVLCEIGLPSQAVERELDADLLKEMRIYLQTYISTNTHPPTKRAALGDALGRLGDPRFYGSDKLCLPAEPDLGLIEVPAGAFYMGTRQADAERMVKQFGWDMESIKREIWGELVHLDSYYLARYPTTVAQFRVFCHAADNGGFKPRDADCLADPDTRPVRYVTWHEAMRYCEWLNERLKGLANTPEWLRRGLHDGRYRVTLSNEAQWEKAARGGIDNNINPRRTFTYGNESDPNCVNDYDTGIGTTSAVGCFAGGCGPYGHHDLLGNVWEWQRNAYAAYPFQNKPEDKNNILDMKNIRVVRGGAFGSYQGWVRCACRDEFHPDFLGGSLGFRVVVSPAS